MEVKAKNSEDCFNILIVEDVKTLHLITKNAFFEETVLNKPIHFISAYNELEAINILNMENRNIAVILLDIVMNEEDGGLKVIEHLRENLNNHITQIIIRTGEPGRFPMREIIDKYDIHDYIDKGDTSDDELYVSVKSAIHTYDALLERSNIISNLEQIIEEKTIDLTQSYKEIEQLFNVSTPLLQIGVNKKIMRANDSFKSLFAIEKDLVGESCHEILGCDKNNTEECCLERLQDGNENHYEYENQKTLSKGNDIEYKVNAIAIKDEQGQVLNIVENILDITELKQANIKTEQEHNKLRTLIDNIPSFIYIKDADSKFIVANHELFEVAKKVSKNSSVLPRNLVGKTDHDIYPKKYADKFLEDEKKIIQSSEPIINKEEKGLNREKDEITILTTKVPLKDRDKVIGIVGIGRDITQLKDYEAQIQQSQRLFHNKYGKFKHNAGNFINSLISNTPKGHKAYPLAWVIASELFIGYELFAQYLIKNRKKIQKSNTDNRKLDFIFDNNFKNIIKGIVKNYKDSHQINYRFDPEVKLEKVNVREIRLIIIALINNAFKHQISGKSIKINVVWEENALTISNTEAKKNKIEKLAHNISSFDLKIEGITLFTIHKYFYFNYKQSIEISYKGKEFFIKLPLKEFRRE